jgi:transcriptional regulator with XRE-family HTH domain
MFSQDDDPRVASEKFGQRIKELRVEHDLSKDRLARRADMHPTAVRRIERGEREPRLTTIRRVARGLGVEPGALLDGWDPLLESRERLLTPEEFERHLGHLPTDGEG